MSEDTPAARNAGPWSHDDNTPCLTFWASRPVPREGGAYWCTEHQQHVHAQAAEKVALTDAERESLHAPTICDCDDLLHCRTLAPTYGEVENIIAARRAAWAAKIEALADEGDRDNYSVRTYELRCLLSADEQPGKRCGLPGCTMRGCGLPLDDTEAKP